MVGWIAALVAGGLMGPAASELRVVWDDPRPCPGAKASLQLAGGEALTWHVARSDAEGVALDCYASADAGATWERRGRIARDADPHADLGDGCFLELADGSVLHSYRRNHTRTGAHGARSYRLEAAVSRDAGRTWAPHSTIAAHEGSPDGLWSTFLMELPDGALQCYHDDEVTPAEAGFAGHQWITMRTWDPEAAGWVRPVTVSRAEDPRALSRDGMASVVALLDGRLFCAFESVRAEPPHRSLIRAVVSSDNGATWSWEREGRSVVFEPADRSFNAVAPWMIRLLTGELVCVFATDEDRETPDVVGTGDLHQDIKLVASRDEGRSWSSAQGIAVGPPLYLPGICELRGPGGTELLVQYVHQGRGCFAVRGAIEGPIGEGR